MKMFNWFSESEARPIQKEIEVWLKHVSSYLDDEITSIDVRLQVYPDGQWAVHSGSSDYDQDHRGYWGASSIDAETNIPLLALELLDQAEEDFATSGD